MFPVFLWQIVIIYGIQHNTSFCSGFCSSLPNLLVKLRHQPPHLESALWPSFFEGQPPSKSWVPLVYSLSSHERPDFVSWWNMWCHLWQMNCDLHASNCIMLPLILIIENLPSICKANVYLPKATCIPGLLVINHDSFSFMNKLWSVYIKSQWRVMLVSWFCIFRCLKPLILLKIKITSDIALFVYIDRGCDTNPYW